MKKILFLLAMLPMMFACSSGEDVNEDEYSQRPVTKYDLENNGGMWSQTKGSHKYYLRFRDGKATIYDYKGGGFDDIRGFSKYELKGDSITLEETPIYQEILGGDTKYYTLYINWIHWGDGSEDQLLIRGDDVPYNFQTGFYNKDIDFTD